MMTPKKAGRGILVIDDERSICDFFIDLFDEYGIEIDVKTTGASGLKQALDHPYALIFLDVKLGDMSGIDVLREIKKKQPGTRVVVISGFLTEDLIEEALQLGVDGYLYKPLAVRDIISMAIRHTDLDQFGEGEVGPET